MAWVKRRRAARAGSFVLAFAFVLPAADAARAAPRPIAQAASLPSTMVNARRHLDADPSARRLFEIGQPGGAGGMRVQAWDFDTLAPAGAVSVDAAQSGFGGMLSTVDELRHRLYVLYPARQADDAAVRDVLGPGVSSGIYDEAARVLFGVAAIDTIRMRPIGFGTLALSLPAVPRDASESNAIGIKAMSYYREGGRDLLYLASEVPVGLGNLAVSNHSVTVHQVDLGRLLDAASNLSAVEWSFPVPQCALMMARGTPGIVFRSPSSSTLSMACRQGGAQGLIAGQPAETPGIVQIRITPGATQAQTATFVSTFHAISGNLQYGVVAVDPLAERMLLQIDGSTTEAAIWIFDIPSATFLGIVALPSVFASGGTQALAVDSSRARLYAISRPVGEVLESTVLITSTDTTVVDQGLITTFRPDPAGIKGRAAVDPVRHRLAMSATEGSIVLQDSLPGRAGGGESSEPDAGTVNVAEGPGTAVNFLGGGQAYGARIRWVGGVGGVDRNVNTLLDPPPSELSPQTGGITPPPPAPGTRDVHFARVLHTTLTNGEASAKASGAQRDRENTDADLGGMANYIRRWGGPDLSDQRWPYPEVECTDFGGADDARSGKGYGAEVACRHGDSVVTALALDESLSQGGIVRIAQARARSAVARDPKRGIVSIVEAEMLGVDLGGQAGIGRVISRAETWATGRPKSANGVGAGGSFLREFHDVWVADADGNRTSVCADSCDPVQVRDEVNRALGLRARIDLPEPEPSRMNGTPGGFEALIVRDPFERANEASVNEEADARRLEVPAMVVTVFADGRVPSRVVISLAGVSAESHYGIFLLSQGAPFRPPRSGGSSGGGSAPSIGPPPSGGSTAPIVGPMQQFLQRTFAGLKFAMASPGRAVRVFAMLALLAGPLVLWRRRSGVHPPGAGP